MRYGSEVQTMGEPANRGRRSSSGGMMMHGVNLKRRFFVSLVLAVPILLLLSLIHI